MKVRLHQDHRAAQPPASNPTRCLSDSRRISSGEKDVCVTASTTIKSLPKAIRTEIASFHSVHAGTKLSSVIDTGTGLPLRDRSYRASWTAFAEKSTFRRRRRVYRLAGNKAALFKPQPVRLNESEVQRGVLNLRFHYGLPVSSCFLFSIARRRRKSKRLGALYKNLAARCHDYCAFTSGNMLC